MIKRHWYGIAAYCTPENEAWLGFVEGLYNKLHGIQRRAYGLRNEASSPEANHVDAPCHLIIIRIRPH